MERNNDNGYIKFISIFWVSKICTMWIFSILSLFLLPLRWTSLSSLMVWSMMWCNLFQLHGLLWWLFTYNVIKPNFHNHSLFIRSLISYWQETFIIILSKISRNLTALTMIMGFFCEPQVFFISINFFLQTL
jgi:hypothetical protein